MFCLINQIFIGLLRFRKSLATKCVSLKKKRCITGPALIDIRITFDKNQASGDYDDFRFCSFSRILSTL